MRTTFTLVGTILLAGVALAISAGYAGAQQPAAPAPSQTAAPAKPATTAPAPAAAATPTALVPKTADEAALIAGVQAFAKAYSEANVKALSEFFTDDSSIVDPSGDETRGKSAILEMYSSAFSDVPGVKLEPTIEDLRFITPEVARASGQSRLSTSSGDATEFTRFSTILVKKDGQWKISEIREYPSPPEDVSPGDRLRELDWMVGDWVDESEENKVSSSVRWADNDSYLIRDYAIEIKGERASSGTMIIGWDPQSAQIKSWLFDSNGGHGEGYWTRTGESEWVVKANGVLRDGRPTSATQIHTIINKDSVKTSSIDRIIGGVLQPDITDIVMVKKPPQPTANAPAGAPAAGAAPAATPR
jgi:uncharacterized protein (TIGR02246 family)